MAFESFMAQLSLLMQEFETRPEDKYELYLQLHEKLNEMRALGLPVPDDLAAFERDLVAEFGPPVT
jgi:hypothetical protein